MSKLLFRSKINFWWKYPQTLTIHNLRTSHQNFKKKFILNIQETKYVKMKDFWKCHYWMLPDSYKKSLLRLGLSHLKDHKFRHNFQDCLNPLCPCSLEAESTIHYFLRCQYWNNIPETLLDIIKKITNISVSKCIIVLNI